MVIGREERKLNKMFQVVFPSKFRKKFGDKLVITKGLEGNLYIVPQTNIDALLVMRQTLFVNKNIRQIQRFLLGNAREIELDPSGRFQIPKYLRVHAEIESEVVFAGVRDYIEVWDKNAWDNQQAFIELKAESIVETISGEKNT